MENLFETLVGKLRKGIVSFVYRKKDCTERHACGTLYGIGHTIKGTHPHQQCSYTLAYDDVDCKGWRSLLYLPWPISLRHKGQIVALQACLSLPIVS